MSEPDGGSRPVAGATELLSVARFREELRRVARFRSSVVVGNPLEAAVRKITQNPAFTQSRLLARVLAALTYEKGEFRRAEIAAFDSETLAMVITLMDAHAAGTSSREDWVCAVDSVRATLLGVQ